MKTYHGTRATLRIPGSDPIELDSVEFRDIEAAADVHVLPSCEVQAMDGNTRMECTVNITVTPAGAEVLKAMAVALEPAEAACCRAPCCGHTDESSCEGPCTVVDKQCNEDYSDCYWIHYCEKHAAEAGY